MLSAALVHRRKQIVERLHEGGVSEYPVAQRGIRQFSHHRDLERGHDLSTFYSEDRRTQYLIGVSVHHSLHEPASLIHFESAGHRTHRQLSDANISSLRVGFRFSQADSSQLRVDKYRVGNQPPVSRGVLLLDQVSANNSIVVVRDMRESGSAFDIAERVDAARRSFETVVHHNETTIISLNLRRTEVQGVRVRHSAGGHQQVRSYQRG